MRVLVSYHIARDQELPTILGRFAEVPEVFADSGAYSAYTQGKDMDLHDYARWLTANRGHLAVMANLDDLTSAERTWRNQKVLEDEYGLAVLPTFHVSEPFSVLERYLDAGYAYIGLGGMVGKPAKALLWWALQCHQRAEGRAVFHGYGVTGWELLAALPWYSVDSSSWTYGLRYADLRLFDVGRDGGCAWRKIDMFTPEISRHGDLIRAHGGDPKTFRYREHYDRLACAAVPAVAYWRAEQWLRKRHGPVRIPGSDAPEGLRLYLVAQGSDVSTYAGGLKVLTLAGMAAAERSVACASC